MGNLSKVLILAVSLLTALNINAETEVKGTADNAAAVTNLAPTGTLNGSDFDVVFEKLEGRLWRAVLDSTASKKPFDIVIDDSEWLRDLYVYEGYAERNDSIIVKLNHDMEFATKNADWKDALVGQVVVLTEIRSLQERSTKSYFSIIAVDDDEAKFYAVHSPSAKPAKNYRKAYASVSAPTPDKKAAKGKKGKKSKKTEDELIEEIMSGNASGFSIESEGDPKLK
jgi:hypothetical protein